MHMILMRFAVLTALLVFPPAAPAVAAALTVRLTNAADVVLVGAIGRWDADGNLRALPDAKAKIDSPAVDAKAEAIGGGRWRFKDLPKGKYDLVILAENRLRIEGFQFAHGPRVRSLFPAAAAVDEETSREISGRIKTSQHYENKVQPLYLGGDKQAVRALVMLIRDKPTSYEAQSPGAATIRHELWQFSGATASGKRRSGPRSSTGCCCRATSCANGPGLGTRSWAAWRSTTPMLQSSMRCRNRPAEEARGAPSVLSRVHRRMQNAKCKL